MKVKQLLKILRLNEEIEVRENNYFRCQTNKTFIPEFYLNREINNMFSSGEGKLVIDLEVKEKKNDRRRS